MRIRRTKADALFSQFIRNRDKCCQRCMKTDGLPSSGCCAWRWTPDAAPAGLTAGAWSMSGHEPVSRHPSQNAPGKCRRTHHNGL